MRSGPVAYPSTASSFIYTSCAAVSQVQRSNVEGDERCSASPDTNICYCLIPTDIQPIASVIAPTWTALLKEIT